MDAVVEFAPFLRMVDSSEEGVEVPPRLLPFFQKPTRVGACFLSTLGRATGLDATVEEGRLTLTPPPPGKEALGAFEPDAVELLPNINQPAAVLYEELVNRWGLLGQLAFVIKAGLAATICEADEGGNYYRVKCSAALLEKLTPTSSFVREFVSDVGGMPFDFDPQNSVFVFCRA